jgi:hypothetical protein
VQYKPYSVPQSLGHVQVGAGYMSPEKSEHSNSSASGNQLKLLKYPHADYLHFTSGSLFLSQTKQYLAQR